LREGGQEEAVEREGALKVQQVRFDPAAELHELQVVWQLVCKAEQSEGDARGRPEAVDKGV
jgi:hypothetical protein